MKTVISVSLALAVGLFAAFILFFGGRFALSLVTGSNPKSAQSAPVAEATSSENAYSKLSLGSLAEEPFTAPKEGKAIYVDLDSMKLSLYKDGALVETVPVVSKGRVGTAWETPPGVYRVETKEENHFSSIGNVWMPSSMQFFGNFFIHGWPYYPGGTPVAQGYSGGCIRLTSDDAKRVFVFAEKGTPIVISSASSSASADLVVHSAGETSQSFYYVANRAAPPRISADAYLVADLDSGDILMERNSGKMYAIASITKLITALTSLDAVNQYQAARVSVRAGATHGDFGGLKVGETLTVSTLLYPLLMESSNDAAEVIAEHYGRDRFLSLMNKKAESIGLLNTHFGDPSGLSPENVSTAQDLFTLAQYIYRYKSFVLETTKMAVKKVEAEVPGSRTHTWYNNNYFVVRGDPKYLGGKNGYTDEAGRTLLSLFSLPLSEFEKKHIAVIVLASENREKDAEQLVRYITKNVYYGVSSDIGRVAVKKLSAPLLAEEKGENSLFTQAGERLAASLGAAKRPMGSDEKDEVKLLFVGDIMADRGVKGMVEKQFAKKYDALFAHATSLADYDITFGNLEGPISDKGKNAGSIYSFRMSLAVAPALKRAGFDIVSVANNHAGDWGQEAFTDTLSHLGEYGIRYTGGGYDYSDAAGVTVIERKGVRVGFLGFSDVGPNWLRASGGQAGILTVDSDFDAIIKRASRSVDVLVVSLHFGDEYQPLSNERQKALARRAVEDGARIVIGHHPHVTQELERYNGGIIAYSLGNFIFDQYFSPETMQGLALAVTVSKEGVGEVKRLPFIINAQYQPLLDEKK